MRLDEITNSNDVWGKLKGTDFNAVEEYNDIVTLLKILIQLDSSYRVAAYSHTIDLFENIMSDLIDNDYSSFPNQSDIKKFKIKCSKMLRNIQYLKSRLP